MKRVLTLIAAVCAVVLTGCGTTAKFIYPDQMSQLAKLSSEPILKKTVAVLPFDDYRSSSNHCCYPLGYIPGMPMGWGNYNRPEAALQFTTGMQYNVTPSEDLAKATAVSLRHSNIFQDAYFTMGGAKKDADYILTGNVKLMKYQGKRLTYCLSFAGPVFWIFGVPAGTSCNRIAVDLELKDKQGKVLWTWSMDKEQWIAQWIYARIGHDCKMFPRIYQEGMNEAMNSLSQQIRSNPALFK